MRKLAQTREESRRRRMALPANRRRRSRQPTHKPISMAAEQIMGRNVPSRRTPSLQRYSQEVPKPKRPVESSLRQPRAAQREVPGRMGRVERLPAPLHDSLHPPGQNRANGAAIREKTSRSEVHRAATIRFSQILRRFPLHNTVDFRALTRRRSNVSIAQVRRRHGLWWY